MGGCLSAKKGTANDRGKHSPVSFMYWQEKPISVQCSTRQCVNFCSPLRFAAVNVCQARHCLQHACSRLFYAVRAVLRLYGLCSLFFLALFVCRVPLSPTLRRKMSAFPNVPADERQKTGHKPPPPTTPAQPVVSSAPTAEPVAPPPAEKPVKEPESVVASPAPPLAAGIEPTSGPEQSSIQNEQLSEQEPAKIEAPVQLAPSQMAQPLRHALIQPPAAAVSPTTAESTVEPADPAPEAAAAPRELPQGVSAEAEVPGMDAPSVGANGSLSESDPPALEAPVEQPATDEVGPAEAAAPAAPARAPTPPPPDLPPVPGQDQVIHAVSAAPLAHAALVALPPAMPPVSEDQEELPPEEEDDGEEGMDYIELQEYTYQELVEASDDFQEDAVLGEGGFGKVYKGVVHDRFPRGGGPPEQAVVAIKKLNPAGYQSKVEWMVSRDAGRARNCSC